jgi:Kef-type K+ transport system membrane component KefB
MPRPARRCVVDSGLAGRQAPPKLPRVHETGHDFLLNDIFLCIVVAWGLGFVARILRQPLILAYLGAGVVLGPVGLGWIESQSSIETISELGLIFLLFMIGLEIDLKKVVRAGRVILITSMIQVLGSAALGWLFFRYIGGEGGMESVYRAAALALSSTVIIVKILYDKRELDTLAGRITLGVLVVQDIFAILFLAIQPTLAEPSWATLGLSIARVAVLVAAALVVSRYALPRLFRSVAAVPELVLVGALAWCFLICGLALGLGLSREMGALIAGVALSTYPYALDVTAKVTALRDFFLTLFFVALGMTIPPPTLNILTGAILFSGLLLLTRACTVFGPLQRMNFGYRVSVLPALNLAQVSEFALVMMALGQKSGHISAETSGMISYAFVFLAIQTSYALVRSERILAHLVPVLRRLGFRDYQPLPVAANAATDTPAPESGSIFFLGFYATASSLVEEISRRHPEWMNRIVVVDFNPVVNQELQRRGVRVLYGDISQKETLLHAGVAHAAVIVSTLPNVLLKGTNNLKLVQLLRGVNPKACLIAHAELLPDVAKLLAAGADYVHVPRVIEAQALEPILAAALRNELGPWRLQLDRALADRHEVIP